MVGINVKFNMKRSQFGIFLKKEKKIIHLAEVNC